MLSSFRSLTALAVTIFAVLALLVPAAAHVPPNEDTDTPVGGLQQLLRPNECVSTIEAPEGGESECGTVISAGTTDAVAVAVTPDGENAYVVASQPGDAQNQGSIATFTRNGATGELSFNHCISSSTSNEPCATQAVHLDRPTHVVATNDFVYVASEESDAVRAFARDDETGVLTPLALPGGCIQETGAGGCTEGDGLDGVQYLALSPDDANPRFLYAVSPSHTSNTAVGAIAILAINETTGALSQVDNNFVAEPGARAAAVSPDGANLYAVSTNNDRIVRFDRTQATGALTRAECIRDSSIIIAPSDCGETANGLNGVYDVEVVTTGGQSDVYTVSRAQGSDPLDMGSSLARFERDTGTGDLSPQGCFNDNESADDCTDVNGIYDATSITARPDGAFLYVTGPGDDAIAYFARNIADGTISQSGAAGEKCVSEGDSECDPDDDDRGLGGVNEAAVTPDGRFLYSTSSEDDAVAEFAIQHAPVCSNITRNDVPFETTVVIPAECVDANQPRDELTVRVQTQPGHPGPFDEGTVVAVDTNGDGHEDSFEYTPPSGFDDSTSFTYDAIDTQGNDSADATVNITVLPTGAPVISIADAARSESDSTMEFTLQRSGPTGSSHVVSFTTQNDTATAGSDYTATSESVTFDSGETQETITVPLLADNVDEVTERFNVNLTGATNSASISDAVAVGTIADDDTSVVSVGDDTVAEDGGPGTLTVTLSNPSSRTVAVTYSTTEGSATSPEDFTAPPSGSSVSFSPGQTSKTITIPIVDDDDVEQTEQFSVGLSGPTGGAALGDSSGQVTITDDELPAVSVGDTAIGEGDSGTRNAAFAVTLAAPTSRTVTVDFATTSGSATAGSDYTSTAGELTFAPGETTKTVNVPVLGDTAEEADETFTLSLATPTNATIGDGVGAGTIQNDDRAPAEQPPPPAPRTTIVVSDTGLAEGDVGLRNATFTVSLSQAAPAAIGVDVTTANGTALAGQDYRAGSGRLTFAPGETTKTVPVPVIGDALPEGDEQFQLRLSNAAGADIVKAIGTATIANDDIRRRLPGLTFTVSPRRDLTLPHVFRVRGEVVLPAGLTAEEACGAGVVTAQYKNGGNTISTRRDRIDDACEFSIRTPFNVRRRLRNAKRLKVVVRFAGNRFLLPRQARSVFVRVRR